MFKHRLLLVKFMGKCDDEGKIHVEVAWEHVCLTKEEGDSGNVYISLVFWQLK